MIIPYGKTSQASLWINGIFTKGKGDEADAQHHRPRRAGKPQPQRAGAEPQRGDGQDRPQELDQLPGVRLGNVQRVDAAGDQAVIAGRLRDAPAEAIGRR